MSEYPPLTVVTKQGKHIHRISLDCGEEEPEEKGKWKPSHTD